MNATEKSSDHQNMPEASSSEWLFEAFSEPRTMPTRWDLSGMEGSLKAPGNNGPAHSAPQQEPGSGEHRENESVDEKAHIIYLNPFSEPKIYPRW